MGGNAVGDEAASQRIAGRPAAVLGETWCSATQFVLGTTVKGPPNADERIDDMSTNNGFWDLDAEDRGRAYDAAYQDTGVENFFDLPAEERGYYYDKYGDPR
jgi:hypothetical protein